MITFILIIFYDNILIVFVIILSLNSFSIKNQLAFTYVSNQFFGFRFTSNSLIHLKFI